MLESSFSRFFWETKVPKGRLDYETKNAFKISFAWWRGQVTFCVVKLNYLPNKLKFSHSSAVVMYVVVGSFFILSLPSGASLKPMFHCLEKLSDLPVKSGVE